MKKLVDYMLVMLLIIIVMPFLIVKGCTFNKGSFPDRGKRAVDADVKVKVYMAKDKKVVEMQLEEYIKGVVAAEMPAEFEPEALKAQAIAARTYAYGRIKKIYSSREDMHDGADICTDPAHCQAWISKDEAKKSWGILSSYKYWSKIEKAVDETRGVIVVYENSVINPVFHSNSGGRTENAEDVWDGVKVPYLKSVQSDGEENNPEFKAEVQIKDKDFTERLKNEYPNFRYDGKDVLKDSRILARTGGERVKSIKIGNITLKGTDIRRIFSLNSANFNLERAGTGVIKIITFGNGHGVGMSQWGANYLAKNGGTYEEILKYYYKGIELGNIS